jgi:transketolase
MSEDLQSVANLIRKKTFATIHHAGGGHFGGTLSAVELLTVLYYRFLRHDPKDPDLATRDRFILGKGHAGPVLYVVLAERGFFPQEWLTELDQGGGHLPKHVDRLKVPGIEYSSGPLGQGLSVAVGMALAAKLDKLDNKIYVLLGDGECDEGQNWEAAMTASQHKLDNLVVMVDRNNCQIDGPTDCVMGLEPFSQKWEAFGWQTQTIDGHNIAVIENAIKTAHTVKGRPSVIIANTVKGKGVSFMENRYEWHSGAITEEQFQIGQAKLESR